MDQKIILFIILGIGFLLFLGIGAVIIIPILLARLDTNGDDGDTNGDDGDTNGDDGDTCSLTCSDSSVLQSAKNYYDTQGVFAGKYTMEPSISEPVGTTQCDIRYNYAPVEGTRGSPGVDSRRFTFTGDDNCIWTATTMGDNMSGTSTAPN